jgi:hypothetical protein
MHAAPDEEGLRAPFRFDRERNRACTFRRDRTANPKNNDAQLVMEFSPCGVKDLLGLVEATQKHSGASWSKVLKDRGCTPVMVEKVT